MAGKRIREVQYNKQSILSLITVAAVVLVLLGVVGIRAIGLHEKNAAYKETKESLEEQIAKEKERTQRIDAYREYVKTDTFIEETAREKLGLIKDSQIVFTPDKNASADNSEDESAMDQPAETGEPAWDDGQEEPDTENTDQ